MIKIKDKIIKILEINDYRVRMRTYIDGYIIDFPKRIINPILPFNYLYIELNQKGVILKECTNKNPDINDKDKYFYECPVYAQSILVIYNLSWLCTVIGYSCSLIDFVKGVSVENRDITVEDIAKREILRNILNSNKGGFTDNAEKMAKTENVLDGYLCVKKAMLTKMVTIQEE
jgi:hypothetical protein